MFGSKKPQQPAAKTSDVAADFGLAACKGCGGHQKGCSLSDEALLEQLGFSPDHPKRKQIVQDARLALE